jgi:hypothetical protein
MNLDDMTEEQLLDLLDDLDRERQQVRERAKAALAALQRKTAGPKPDAAQKATPGVATVAGKAK